MDFKIGFWHPFGPHAGEGPEDIIKRKIKEIQDNNGWTLWSFQFRKTLKPWFEEIKKVKVGRVLVFCSNGRGNRDTKSEPKCCNYYVPIDEIKPRKIPSNVKIPHPMGKKTRGSAFIVKNIIYPVEYENINLEWFYAGKEKWQDRRSSTRGEHLIRIGNGKPIGKFCAVLELKYPYLAEFGVN